MLGGAAKIWQHTVAEVSQYNAEISIDFGYLWHKNLVSGVRPSYSWSFSDEIFQGVFFTRYYYPLKTFSPFIEANVGYSYRNIFSVIDMETFSVSESTLFGGKVGGAFFVAPKVTFDVFFFYDAFWSTIHNKSDLDFPSTKLKENSLGLGFGFQIFL